MDRQIIFAGSVPLETDLLNAQKNALFALGQFAQDVLGTSTVFTGLGCVPNTPAAMNVIVQPGAVYAQAVLDATAYSSLLADSTTTQKQGILKAAQTFATPAPTTSGQSVVYLISASFLEVDTNAVVLPYYNASNPAQAYSGPNNTGASQNTTRQDTVQLTLTAGVPATTGSQLTPATPAGQIALYTVTVAYGATSVVAGNIAKVAGAPFLATSLLALAQQNAPDGQCRLAYTSATVLTLNPENGNSLNIGGTAYTIPSAGVTLSNSGLSASTLYWIYAIVSNGAIALQASTTGFTRQSDGRYTMSGNTAARLVGAAYTNASSQFVSSGTNQNVVSFFNRRPLPFNLGGAGGTTTSTTLTPINSGTVTCISFGLDSTAVQFLVNGYSSVAAGSWASGILIDGASGASTQGLATSAAAAQINNNPSMFSGYLSAGYHTLAGAVNVNTGGGSITVTGSMIGQTWG